MYVPRLSRVRRHAVLYVHTRLSLRSIHFRISRIRSFSATILEAADADETAVGGVPFASPSVGALVVDTSTVAAGAMLFLELPTHADAPLSACAPASLTFDESDDETGSCVLCVRRATVSSTAAAVVTAAEAPLIKRINDDKIFGYSRWLPKCHN